MCKQCEKNPVYEFTNKRKLCKKCFVRYFQKKILYTIRKFRMAKKGDIIGYENKGDFRNMVLEDVLRMFAEKADAKIIRISANKSQKITKIALTSTIDTEAYKIVHALIHRNLKNLKNIFPLKNKIIKPLYLFLDEEVLLYAKIRNLKFKQKKEKKDKISLFIDVLEKKHPEVKRAIVNSYLKICS